MRLSEIARSLEENISIKKIIERLGRQLQRGGLREQVRENLLQLAAGRIDSQTLLLVDPTDINKPYAKKMQYLAPVRDGSEGRIQDGYWCCQSGGGPLRQCSGAAALSGTVLAKSPRLCQRKR